MSESIEQSLLPAGSRPELHRYLVRIQTHTGRVLQRRVVTYYREYKAVALACELIHRQLGCDDPSVTADRVFVDDLGPVKPGASGVYDLESGDASDRHEF